MSEAEAEEASRVRRRRWRRVARWTIVKPLKAAWWIVSRSFLAGWRAGRWALRRRRRRAEDNAEAGAPPRPR